MSTRMPSKNMPRRISHTESVVFFWRDASPFCSSTASVLASCTLCAASEVAPRAERPLHIFRPIFSASAATNPGHRGPSNISHHYFVIAVESIPASLPAQQYCCVIMRRWVEASSCIVYAPCAQTLCKVLPAAVVCACPHHS